MDDLPQGWAVTTIGDIAAYISRGRSPRYIDASALPVINQKCVRWHGIEEQHLKFVDPETWHQWKPEHFVQNGDLLWNSTGTGTIGRATLFRGLRSFDRAVVDSHVTIVRPTEAIDPEYLFGFIRSPLVQERIGDMQSGSTNQVELNRGEIASTQIPLPPLAEQRSIASKLRRLTGRVSQARDDLSRIPYLIAKYKQALLDSALSGAMTRSWRKERELPDWKRVTVADVAAIAFDGPFGSNLKSSDYVDEGVRVVRLETLVTCAS
jgi:type I restriction enzyme S subunit